MEGTYQSSIKMTDTSVYSHQTNVIMTVITDKLCFTGCQIITPSNENNIPKHFDENDPILSSLFKYNEESAQIINPLTTK